MKIGAIAVYSLFGRIRGKNKGVPKKNFTPKDRLWTEVFFGNDGPAIQRGFQQQADTTPTGLGAGWCCVGYQDALRVAIECNQIRGTEDDP